MNDIITTAACPHCGSGASWRRALPTTGGRPVRLCTVCGRVSVDEDWTVPAGAEPARVLPSREDIEELILAQFRCTANGWRLSSQKAAEDIQALLAGQPTVAEVKAEAWEEAATWFDADLCGVSLIIRDRANRLSAAQPTPDLFEAMGLSTPEVPNVGGEGR